MDELTNVKIENAKQEVEIREIKTDISEIKTDIRDIKKMILENKDSKFDKMWGILKILLIAVLSSGVTSSVINTTSKPLKKELVKHSVGR